MAMLNSIERFKILQKQCVGTKFDFYLTSLHSVYISSNSIVLLMVEIGAPLGS